MKKRGFTLIELLAVIVVLGVIGAVITPVITGVLTSAEEDAYNKQVDNIVKAAETWGLQNLEKLISFDNEICVLVDGNLYEIGSKYSCELGDNEEKTFYVLENNDDTVSLIMNMNIDSNGKGTTSGNTVAWCKSGDNNSCAADGALEYLKTSTASWTKLNQSQISMPTGEQIAKAGGDTVWNDGNLTGTVLSSWLSENLNDMSAPYGYWTSTPVAFDSEEAWHVYSGGLLLYSGVGTDSNYGVRPVITISKKQIVSNDQDKTFNKMYLSLDTLINDGIIENSEIINPKTNEQMSGCVVISYSEEYNQYEYKYVDDNKLCK